jgi:hypothetical protein
VHSIRRGLPENRALMLTAVLLTLSVIPRLSRMAGAMFSVLCAKSQNVNTASTMPKMTVSVPRYP